MRQIIHGTFHSEDESSKGRHVQGTSRSRKVSSKGGFIQGRIMREKMLGCASVGDTLLSWHENVTDASFGSRSATSMIIQDRYWAGRTFTFYQKGCWLFWKNSQSTQGKRLNRGSVFALSAAAGAAYTATSPLCVYLVDILTVVYLLYTHIHSYISAPKLSPMPPPASIS